MGGGGPCDYCVSPSPKNWVFGFFRLGPDLGSGFGACWTGDWGLGLGLDNSLHSSMCTDFRINKNKSLKV